MEEESTTQENSAKNSNSQPQDSDSKQSRTKAREHGKMLVTSEVSFSLCAYLDHIWIIQKTREAYRERTSKEKLGEH